MDISIIKRHGGSTVITIPKNVLSDLYLEDGERVAIITVPERNIIEIHLIDRALKALDRKGKKRKNEPKS